MSYSPSLNSYGVSLHKICRNCGIMKSIKIGFYKNKGNTDGYRNQCKICKNKQSKKWETDNREYSLQLRADYRENNREKIRIWQRADYIVNKEKRRNSTKKWESKNNDKLRAKDARYNASKLRAIPSWANEKYIKLFYKLAIIEEKRTNRKVHVDHIVPLQSKLVCGLHCEDNLQLLFESDNASKSNYYWQDMWI